MYKRLLLSLGMVLVMLPVVAACGGTQPNPTPSPTPSSSSGIHGILLFAGGPYVSGSPSPLPDGFGTTESGRPYYGAKIVVKAKPSGLPLLVQPSANGLFTVALSPGTYVLTPKVPKNGPFPMPTTVAVKPGEFARVKVYVSGP